MPYPTCLLSHVSLVCCGQELYGNQTAALFTGALSRLLTNFLQLHGFSCGVDDLLLQVRSPSQSRAGRQACCLIACSAF